MNVDYSNYKMTDYKWYYEYKDRLGKEKFYEFMNMVYKWLMNLKPGQSLNISSHPKITERNRDLFIKTACMFISEGNSHYSFSSNYTTITNNSYVPEPRKPKTGKNLEK